MYPNIDIFVPGVPRPGGSKSGSKSKTGKIAIYDAGKHTKEWRAIVAMVASEAMKDKKLLVNIPVRLNITFVMPRPKSHYRTGNFAGILKHNAPYWHTKKPDATKLLRSTEDALTGIIWQDDAQVVYQSISKVYGLKPGANIIISEQV